ncbi:hypothetical protein C2E23DRAFT_858981 [Lenzites betulinus]|nr:hypothetical protein C2E23DRAFT_858981 [Lenzites betulinus]
MFVLKLTVRPGPIDPNNIPSVDHFYNNPCACNTVLYSLVYVCGQCGNSGDLEDPWSEYTSNLKCSGPSMQSYPQYFNPSLTSIPAWAYLPLGSDGKVNMANAQAVAGEHLPDMTTSGSTSVPIPKATPTTVSPPPAPPPQAPPSNPTPAPSNPPSTPQISPAPNSPTLSSPLSLPTTANTDPTPPDNTPIYAGQPSSAGASNGVPTTSPSAGSPQNDPVLTGSPTSSTSPSTPEASGAGGTPAQHAVPAASDMVSSSGSLVYGPSGVHSNSPSSPTNASDPPNSPATGSAAAAQRSNHIGAILGGVFGAIAALLMIALALCLVRRRRRQRAEAAVVASGSLDWWRRDTAEKAPPTDVEASDSSTIRPDDNDFDDLETLHGTSVEKKSVMYGEYPDL